MFYYGGVQTFLCLMLLFNTSVVGTFCIKNTTSTLVVVLAKAILHLLPGVVMIYLLGVVVNTLPSRKIKRFVEFIIVSIAGIISISDWFLIYQYHDVLDQSKLGILMGTDPGTAKEFFEVYVLHWNVLLSVLLGVSLIAYFIYKVYNYRLTEHVSIGILVCLVLSVFSIGYIGVKSVLADVKVDHKIESWKYNIFYDHLSLVRVGMDFLAAKEQLGNEEDIYSAMDALDMQRNVDAGSMNVPYVVYILGESVDRNHMSLYGYNLETTPLLQKRADNGELAVFTDTISCANGTAMAMSLVFNSAPKDYAKDGMKWYEYHNLIDILKQADYHTVWLSNQEPVGRWGNLDKIYGQRSDESKFLHVSGGVSGGGIAPSEYDEKLLQPLDEYIAKNNQAKQYYTIHLFGAHEAFKTRYPSSFAKFDLKEEIGASEEVKKLKAEYDNAVYYDDYVVNEIIKRFEDKNAIVFFISDHGMDLFDTAGFAGHTTEEKGSKHMIEIPFVVWASQQYRGNYPDIWNKICKATNNPYRTDYLMYTILDSIGVRYSQYDARYSVIDDSYVAFPRIYSGKVYER